MLKNVNALAIVILKHLHRIQATMEASELHQDTFNDVNYAVPISFVCIYCSKWCPTRVITILSVLFQC